MKLGRTSEVGSYRANPFRLCDMHGNVWEWVEDCWNDSYERAGRPDDGSAWTAGDCSRRVLRGGSWDDDSDDLRSAFRVRKGADFQVGSFGFRVARTLSRSESVASLIQTGRKRIEETPPASFSDFAKHLLIALSKKPGETLNLKDVAELGDLKYEKGWIARASEYLDEKGLISAKPRRHLQSGPDDDYYGVMTGIGLAEAEKLQTGST